MARNSQGKNIKIPADITYEEYKRFYIKGEIKTADFQQLTKFVGALDNVTVRQWYIWHDEHIHEKIPEDLPLEEKARRAFELRNEYRTQARELMEDKAAREELDAKHPNPTFEEMLNHKMKDKEMAYEQALEDIYKTAVKSNSKINKKLNLE